LKQSLGELIVYIYFTTITIQLFMY